MAFNWRTWRERSPRTFIVMVVAKRARTRVGLVLFLAVLAESFFHRDMPLDLDQLSFALAVAVVLIVAGCVLRLAACGCLRKKEELATGGVYSLCRHPLYLGSMLLTFGFCVLLNNIAAHVIAACYFVLFYPLVIAWEEIRLQESYGAAHREYAARTPLLLPLGRFRPQIFSWSWALRNGGGTLMAVTVLLLAGIEAMAKMMRGH